MFETVDTTTWILSIIAGIVILAIVGSVLSSMMFRKVVSTNTVHIVQSRKTTTSYGANQPAGNVYYKWPSWMPIIGVSVSELPVSNFDLKLDAYKAYDKDRVPFEVDVAAFFRIANTDIAARRVASVEELEDQLTLIVQGAVRKVLASRTDNIDTIMLERARFGAAFTSEVVEQLKEWGVESVKSMELMDIRDSDGSKVIANIMAKRTSAIEKESRVEVAENKKIAEIAEIEAKQKVDIRKQEAEQLVGERTAEKTKAVGIATQKSTQEVKVEEKKTAEKEMEVLQVNTVKKAEIDKEKAIIVAEQDKQVMVTKADGDLEKKKKDASGAEIFGKAEGAALEAKLLAPVNAQIKLAEEIGNNPEYQKYLAMIEAIKAYMAVGGEQAKALQKAHVNVIANAGSATDGVDKVMDLFSSKGGTEISAMVQAFAQTPIGKATLKRLGIKEEDIIIKDEAKAEDPKKESETVKIEVAPGIILEVKDDKAVSVEMAGTKVDVSKGIPEQYKQYIKDIPEQYRKYFPELDKKSEPVKEPDKEAGKETGKVAGKPEEKGTGKGTDRDRRSR